MSKTVVIHHSADFDGLFCREIAHKFLPDSTLIGWDYGDPVPTPDVVSSEDELYMLDISIESLMGHPNLIWIDHHKSAMEKYGTKPGYQIDGVAACRLAWAWFKSMPEFATPNFAGRGVEETLPNKQQFIDRMVEEPLAVRLAGEYDIWDKRDPDAELFQHGLRSVDLNSPVYPTLGVTNWWYELLRIPNTSEIQIMGSPTVVDLLLKRGKIVEYVRKEEYAEVIKEQGFDVEFKGLKFLACCSHELDIRSHLFEAGIKPEHDALMGFTFTGKDWRVSMYGVPGKPDIDLSKIAVKYGGGGHKQACGFRANKLPFLT